MSIAVQQPIKVYIKWGQARGKKQVEAALHATIIRAMNVAIRYTIDLMEEIVPESEFRSPPYPPSYKSEALLQTAITILRKSFKEMKAGGGLKKVYRLRFGFPASYARYINLKRNVRKWSKKGSKTGFAGETKQMLIREFRLALKIELQSQRAAKLALTKYIGVKRYG